MSTPRARVFLSCGQSKKTDERAIAQRISERLKEMGFEPYIAVAEQTLKGVKENIFRQLEASEYFIFIDFKREPIAGGDQHRGSLFSHQELAVAAFLDKEVIAFQEQGVELNGVAAFIQANAKSFSDRENLPAIVADEVRVRQWDPGWQNELTMLADPPSWSDANRVERDVQGNVQRFAARFYHVHVRNHHRSKPAINCYAYLERVENAETEEAIDIRTIEHKWAGYTFPNAIIGPSSQRSFDAFWVPLGEAISLGRRGLRFNVFADSTDFIPRVERPGEYLFTYRVISENFRSVTATFRVSADEAFRDIKMSRFEDNTPRAGG
ncbi:MAG TPA: hypothetical protein VM487_03975 [Phycisphaerae bacterium]|nr:hypothetical protein [Phycisphaerae bacterium]